MNSNTRTAIETLYKNSYLELQEDRKSNDFGAIQYQKGELNGMTLILKALGFEESELFELTEEAEAENSK